MTGERPPVVCAGVKSARTVAFLLFLIVLTLPQQLRLHLQPALAFTS